MFLRTARLGIAVAVLTAGALLLGSGPSTGPKTAGPPELGRVLVVPVHGPIDRIQEAFLRRALGGAEDNYDAVILDIHTPGGRVDVMGRMSERIIELEPTPTIGFVSRRAMSAGAFIAMSCDRIYMGRRSRIGAARPWIPGPGGMPAELPKHIEEKMLSDLRAQVRAIAKDKGYPPAIAEGMTDEAIEVVEVEIGGKREYVTGGELAELRKDPLASAKLGATHVVSRKGRLITFDPEEAVRYSLARAEVEDLDALLATEGLSGVTVARKEMNWSDKVVMVLTAPPVMGLLVLIAFGALWLELKIPGFGVAGTVSIVAFLVVFSSQFLIGNANALEILLFVVGVALLAIELFVTPGFGVIGGAGLLCLFGSLVLATQPFLIPETPWEVRTFEYNLLAILGGMAGSFLLLVVFAWMLPTTSLFRRITLERELKTQEGYSASETGTHELVGREGVVTTELRPAGKMEVDDRTYSVVSDAEYVGAGDRVRVLRVDGPKIVVEPVKAAAPPPPDFKP
jgi:membrane-bound serine protease (ClpP class)